MLLPTLQKRKEISGLHCGKGLAALASKRVSSSLMLHFQPSFLLRHFQRTAQVLGPYTFLGDPEKAPGSEKAQLLLL